MTVAAAPRQRVRYGAIWVVLISALQLLTVATRVGAPMQPLISVLFVLTCPGFFALDLNRPAEPSTRLLIGITSSLGLNVLIFTVLAMADARWLLPVSALILIGLALLPRHRLQSAISVVGDIAEEPVTSDVHSAVVPEPAPAADDDAPDGMVDETPNGPAAVIEAPPRPELPHQPPPSLPSPPSDTDSAPTADGAEQDRASASLDTPLVEPEPLAAPLEPPPVVAPHEPPRDVMPLEPIEIAEATTVPVAPLREAVTPWSPPEADEGHVRQNLEDTGVHGDERSPPEQSAAPAPSEPSTAQQPEPLEADAGTRPLTLDLPLFTEPVNLNTASVDRIATLPGVGRQLAERIVRYRNQNGPFADTGDLLFIRGIGMAKLDGFIDLVVVEDVAP